MRQNDAKYYIDIIPHIPFNKKLYLVMQLEVSCLLILKLMPLAEKQCNYSRLVFRIPEDVGPGDIRSVAKQAYSPTGRSRSANSKAASRTVERHQLLQGHIQVCIHTHS